MLGNPNIDQTIRDTAGKVELGEDLIGLLGRLGDTQQVVLCVDDGHLQSRSLLLGLPIFLEPASHRNALLVCTAPDDSNFDGALTEVTDAQRRGILSEIQLPDVDGPMLTHLMSQWGSTRKDDERISEVLERVSRVQLTGLRFKVARAWAQDLVEQPDVSVATECDISKSHSKSSCRTYPFGCGGSRR